MKGKEERETGEEGLSVGGGVRREWDEPAPGMDVDSARPQLHTLKIAKSPLGVGGSASSPTSASASASAPPTIVTSTSTSTSTGATITTATTATTSQSQSQSQVQTSASALGLPTPTSTVSTSAVGAGGSGGAGGLGGGNAGGGGGAHRWSTSSSITAVTASSPTSPMYANPPSSSSSTQRGWKTHAKAASALNMNLTPRELLLQSAQMHRPRAGTVYLGGDGRAHHDYPYPTDAEVEAEAVNANAHYVQVHAEVAPPLARKPLRIPVPALPHAVAAPDAYAHGEGVPARWIPFSATSSSASSSNPSSSAYLAELVKRYTAPAPGEHPGKLSGEDRGRDRDECEGEPGAHTDAPSPHAHTSIHTPAWIREARQGKFTRQFRWGALDILNAAHCDFVPLRRAVFECMTVRSLLFF